MKTLVFIVALFAPSLAFADGVANTVDNFEALYSRVVNDANNAGVHPESRCWKEYCSLHQVIQYSATTGGNGVAGGTTDVGVANSVGDGSEGSDEEAAAGEASA